MIRIVIADDADLTILGAASVLSADHRYNVVGEARCVADLLDAVESAQPDVVVMSEWLHSLDILSAVEAVRERLPTLRVIVMGGLADGLLICDLLDAGVNGYLYKSDDLCELLPGAVHAVMRDRPYLSPTASAEYLVATQSEQVQERLDPEARAVLRLLAQGEHVGQIALALDIPTRRVYWLREKLRRRFGARTNEHMISRAAAEGFIYPGE
jgi:DNA-binding NarL/FixJ family response regulator